MTLLACYYSHNHQTARWLLLVDSGSYQLIRILVIGWPYAILLQSSVTNTFQIAIPCFVIIQTPFSTPFRVKKAHVDVQIKNQP